ncbi:hypothetical protein Gotur_028337 [Gossypium turneri]
MDYYHKRPNKGKTTNLNQGFVMIPAQASFYPNQGYYIPYPMVRQPVGTHLSFTPKTTDGRRILAYYTGSGNIQEDRDKECVQLLKMIADMEIDDFPSHIIEKIKEHVGDLELTKTDIQERNLRKQILKYGQKEAT